MQNQSQKFNFPKELTKKTSNRDSLSGGGRGMDVLNLLMRNSSMEAPPQFNSEISEEPVRIKSYGNLFSGTIQDEGPKQQLPRYAPKKSYAMECLEYQKYLFDNRIKLIIKRMSIKAYNLLGNKVESPFFVFPIQKLLITISKKLHLNRFELLFLQYVFEQTKWHYDIQCIKKHASNFNSFIFLTDSESSNQQIRYMQIYILYCAYYSKKSLNELPTDMNFDELFDELCPKFKDEFPQWTQNSNMPNKINPKTLNNIFKKLTYQFDRDHEESQNYSLIVEEIIDISPAYNADKGGKEKRKGRKKKARQTHEKIKPEMNSSQFHERNIHLEDIVEHNSPNYEMGEINFRTKKSSFMSNVDALEPKNYISKRHQHMQ